MRDLGKAGEDLFSGWCALSGMTANKAVSDRHGWDLFVEIDQDRNALELMSLHEGPVETKIQIKATDGKQRSVSVELSNLKKMATTPLPTFYVLIEFDSTSAPTGAYLLHVDNSLSTKILKKVAELLKIDPKAKLNKKTMKLKFVEEISPLSPERLKEMIVSAIGGSGLSYIEAKTNHLRNVGFEKGTHQIAFSIKGDSQLQKLIDMSLGAKCSVNINDIHGSSLRFGVATDLPLFGSDSAVLEMIDVMPDFEGKLTFTDHTTGRSLKFTTKLYRGKLNAWIPDSFKKARMDSKLFEIQLVDNGRTLRFSANTKEFKNVDICEGLKLFKLINMLWNPNDVRLGFEFPGLSTHINLYPMAGFSDCSDIIGVIEAAIKVKRHFELEEPLFVSLTELEDAYYKLEELSLLISGEFETVSLKLPPDVEIEPDTEVDCFHVASLILGDYIFAELLLITGTASKLDAEKYSVSVGSIKSLYRATIRLDDQRSDFLKNDIQNAMNACKTSGKVIDLVPLFFLGFSEADS